MSGPIPIVALGVYRQVAASTNVLFQPTPYQLSAIFDIKSSIPSINPTYSAQNLAVTLRSMYPRPQVFILGIMIEEKTAAEAVQVWNEYVKEFSDPDGESKVQMIEEDRQKAESEIGAPPAVWEGLDKTLVINMVLDPPTTPDWKGYIMGKLTGTFGV